MIQIYFLIILILVIIFRFFEVIPNIYIYFTTRKGYSVKLPSDFRLESETISYEIGEKTQEGWFFQGDGSSPASIILIPDWTDYNAFSNNIKTAGVLQLMGYSVLIPLVHHVDESTQQVDKNNFSTQYYRQSIEKAYEYLLFYEHINKRQIGIYCESLGTVFGSTLVSQHPIKGIVLENGPITLSRLISGKIPISGRLAWMSEIILRIVLWPVLWRTRWHNRSSLSKIGSCPTFQISIYNHKYVPIHDIFTNYDALYKPKQLWIEHSLLPEGGIRDTWPQEFFSQINAFFDLYFNDIPTIAWQSDQKAKKDKQGNFNVHLTVHALPPQMDDIPIRVSLSDKKKNIAHKRINFTGAEMNFEFELPFKPRFSSLIKYFNVQKLDKEIAWVKLDAQQALEHTIDTIASLNPSEMIDSEERYLRTKKGILKDIDVS